MADTKEIREVKSRRRVLEASLDLNESVRNIIQLRKLRPWEVVEVLQEMAFKFVNAAIKLEQKRGRAKRKSARA